MAFTSPTFLLNHCLSEIRCSTFITNVSIVFQDLNPIYRFTSSNLGKHCCITNNHVLKHKVHVFIMNQHSQRYQLELIYQSCLVIVIYTHVHNSEGISPWSCYSTSTYITLHKITGQCTARNKTEITKSKQGTNVIVNTSGMYSNRVTRADRSSGISCDFMPALTKIITGYA